VPAVRVAFDALVVVDAEFRHEPTLPLVSRFG
jgi:hypothetical protein